MYFFVTLNLLIKTKQHQELKKLEEWRNPVKIANKQGMRASLENIIFKKEANVDKGILRLHCSQPKTVIRNFLGAVWKFGWNEKSLTDNELTKN